MVKRIKCPDCGNERGVRQIAMIYSFAYLCPQQGCKHFDQKTRDNVFGATSDVETKAERLMRELDDDAFVSPVVNTMEAHHTIVMGDASFDPIFNDPIFLDPDD